MAPTSIQTLQPKRGQAMRFYTEQNKYYWGIDLHARKMYVCILDQAGRIRVHIIEKLTYFSGIKS